MTDAVTRALADLEAGRAWKARDRLTGLLTVRQDDELLDLLASVHLRMGELPKAGALLYVLRRETPEASHAIQAWRERYGDPEARWRSIPAPVRDGRTADLDVLRGRQPAPGVERDLPAPGTGERPFLEVVGCLVASLVGLALVALLVVGAVTVVSWVF